MFCPNCGARLEDDSLFCGECGTAVEEPLEENEGVDRTEFVESGIDFGDNPSLEGLGELSDPFTPQGTPSAGFADAPVDTTFVAPDGQQAMMFAQPAATPQAAPAKSSGNKIVITVAIVAVVAVLVVAAVAFFVLRPQASATYNVQFETDGGTAIAAQQVEEGSQVTSPSSPKKDGYEFEGWYLDSECTEKVHFPFSPEGDAVLYAKWGEAPAQTASSSSSSSSAVSATVGSGSASKSGASTVKITVVGADGTTRTADIHRSGSTERVLPDSNSRVYSDSEIASLSDAELCIAWNEIIAANSGYTFRNSGLRDYFNSCSWYRPSGGSGNAPGGAAGENVAKLKAHLSDSWWTSLATY